MRDLLRTQHYVTRTEQAYVDWAKRFILFHHQRHPKDMGIKQIEQFLTHLAKDVKTTMIYTHVLNRGGLAVRSPLD